MVEAARIVGDVNPDLIDEFRLSLLKKVAIKGAKLWYVAPSAIASILETW